MHRRRASERVLSVDDNSRACNGGESMSDGDAETDGVLPCEARQGSSEQRSDGGNVRAYTVRLELVDEPGELLSALAPIAENGGNLLSIFHERGSLTPRGHIPVEVDLECPPDRFETIVEALRDAGVNVIQAGAERYSEEVALLLVGDVVDTDLSDTVDRVEACGRAVVTDLSLSAPSGAEDVASARLRLAIEADRTADALAAVREVAGEKDLRVVEPLTDRGGSA
jgi:ACT domain-containing protein